MITDRYDTNNKTYTRRIELVVGDESVMQEITYTADFKQQYDGSESHLKKKTKEVIFTLASEMMKKIDSEEV